MKKCNLPFALSTLLNTYTLHHSICFIFCSFLDWHPVWWVLFMLFKNTAEILNCLWNIKCEFVGIMTGWASEAVRKLKMSNSTLLEDGAITDEQASWIPALKSLIFVLNIPIFGLIANKFGRKWPLNFLAIPLMVRSWTTHVENPINITIRFPLCCWPSDVMDAHLFCKKYLLHLCSTIFTRHGHSRHLFAVSVLFCRDIS